MSDLRAVVKRGQDRIALYEGYDGDSVGLNSVNLGDFRVLLFVAAAAAEWAEAEKETMNARSRYAETGLDADLGRLDAARDRGLDAKRALLRAVKGGTG